MTSGQIVINNTTSQKQKSLLRKKRINKTILLVVMSLLAVVVLFPFYYSVVTSFRLESNILTKPIAFWPESFDMTNYKVFFTALKDLDDTGNLNIFRLFFNTIFTVATIIAGSLLVCGISGYSLARLNYKGKKIIIKIFYISMMIPGVATLIPQYSVVRTLGLIGGLEGIIIPALFSIYGTLFLRSFFLSTPKEIAEAARIDGAGEMRIFLTLYLKMVVPGLITLGLMTFNSNWNSYLWPSMVLRFHPEEYVFSVALKEFQSRNASNFGPTMAAAIISILPTIIIFLVGQRFFLDNLSFSGIK